MITLAHGIGANTAIFSLLNAMELRRLPVRAPRRLVMLEWSADRRPHWTQSSTYGACDADTLRAVSSGCNFSYPAFEYLRTRAKRVTGLVAIAGPAGAQARVHGEIVHASAQFASGNFFPALGVNARLGRTLLESDDAAGSAAVAVLSSRFWDPLS